MSVLVDVAAERARQDAKWGEQNHVDADALAGHPIPAAPVAKRTVDRAAKGGYLTWADILIEEVAEAIDEAVSGATGALREELIQVAAVATQWAEAIDRRAK